MYKMKYEENLSLACKSIQDNFAHMPNCLNSEEKETNDKSRCHHEHVRIQLGGLSSYTITYDLRI